LAVIPRTYQYDLLAFNNNQHRKDATASTTTIQTPKNNPNKKQNPTHNPPESLCTETTHNNNQREKNKTTHITKYEYLKQKPELRLSGC